MCHLELSQPGSCTVDHADHYSWGDATAIWNRRFLLWWLLCVGVLWLLCSRPRRKGSGTSIKAWACWVSETTSYDYAINSDFQICQHLYLPEISSFYGLFLPMAVTEPYTFRYSAIHILLIIWLQPWILLFVFLCVPPDTCRPVSVVYLFIITSSLKQHPLCAANYFIPKIAR